MVPAPRPRHRLRPPSKGAPDRAEPFRYTGISVVEPARGETVRDNQGNVRVALSVEPELNEEADHRIRIMLDGRAWGEPSPSLEQTVTGVRRGSHRVSAQVVDERGRVLARSPSVGFYLIVASPLFHPPRPDAPSAGVQQAPRAPMAPRAPRAPHAPFRPAPPVPSPPPPSPR